MTVSLAVLSVVTGVSAISFGAKAGKLQISNQAKILGSEMIALKIIAGESGCDYELRPSPLEVFSYCNQKTKALSLPKGIVITSSNPIIFYRTGVVSPGTLRMRTKDNQCILTISLRGRVTVQCM